MKTDMPVTLIIILFHMRGVVVWGGEVTAVPPPALSPANLSDYFEYVDYADLSQYSAVDPVPWCESGCRCSDELEQEADCGPRGRAVAARGGDWVHVFCGEGALDPQPLPALHERDLDAAAFYDCAPPAAGYSATLRALGAVSVSSLVLHRPLTAPDLGLADLPRLVSLTVDSGPDWRAAPPSLPTLRRWILRTTTLPLTNVTFIKAPPLEWLEISMGDLNAIPERAFTGLSSLKRLGLWGNIISDVSASAFDGLGQLKELDLSDNRLSSLPDGVFAPCEALEVVSLSSNELTRELRREWWGRGASLVSLQVSQQRGWGSPREGWAAGLPALREVRADGAGFSALPEGSFAGSALIQNLSLEYNRLETVPARLFRDLRDLRSLTLAHNRLSSLPGDVFSTQVALLDLDLSYNRLETLPDGLFAHAVSLRRLRLPHNRLTSVSRPALLGLVALRELHLGHNLLRLADRGQDHLSPLDSLTELRTLDLAHNNVSAVFDDWRISLLHLRLLNLTYNNLTYLSVQDLNFLSEKVELDVRHNNITSLVITPLEEGEGGSAVIALLDHNPWQCDCRLWGLLSALRAGGPPDPRLQLRADSALCAGPPPLRGVPLSEVPQSDVQCSAPWCPSPCTCTQRPADTELRILCDWLPSNATWPDHESMGLSWSSLYVRSGPVSFRELPPHVRVLVLRNTSLEAVPGDWSPPRALALLDLSDNNISTIPTSLYSSSNDLRILLAKNPLRCGCADRVNLRLLLNMSRMIEDWEDIVCSNGQTPRNAEVDVCGVPSGVVLGAIVAAVVVVSAACVGVWVWRRGPAAWWTFAEPDDDGDYEYDVFVSFCHADTEFVQNELARRLEPEWSLCLHYRDWRVGEWIPAQIARSVTRSRRVLVVVSPQWAGSTWARLELRAAEGLRGGLGIIVLVRGEVSDLPTMAPDLANHYRSRTVLSERDPRVWSRLRSALPRPRAAPALLEKKPPSPHVPVLVTSPRPAAAAVA